MIKNILSKIKKVGLKGKILVSIAALAAALMPLSSTIADTTVTADSANQPRFNFLAGDVEMLKEATPAMSDWADPISTTNGNKVAFLFYFHNGVLNTTAHNTKARVDLPNDASTKLQMTSYLWSDETPFITDTVVNGAIVGNSGATINLDSAARIRYIPGSTRIYRNGSQTGTALADGIASSAGINIGDIQGCWNFSGYITFQAELFGNTKMTIEKTVTHPGSTEWFKQINANPGDTVSYHLGIRNDGDLNANDVLVKDQLATYTTYIPGTTYLFTKETGPVNGIKLADTLNDNGVKLSEIKPGDDGTEYIRFQVKIDNSIPAGTYGLVNVASVFLGGVLQDRDEAKVIVVSTSSIDVNKTVYDPITRNWEKISNAGLGDVRTFRILIKNTGNTPLKSVQIRDVLPEFTHLVDGIKVNGQEMTAQDKAGFFSNNGFVFGDLQPGCQIEILLQVIVDGCPPLGESLLTNTAYVWAQNAAQVISSAQIRVHIDKPVTPRVIN